MDKSESDINRVSVKVPVFWPGNVKLYFAQLEANFRIAGISVEQTKFDTLVAALDGETLGCVSDIIFNPPKDNPYTTLKSKLISEFEFSQVKKIKTLLSDVELADRKPSVLLRIMKDLSENHIDDSFMKDMWLNRLPVNVQTILSISSEPLSKLAEMADRILDYSSGGISTAEGVNMVEQKKLSDNKTISHLQETVEKLEAQVKKLSLQLNKNFNNERVFENKRSFSPGRKFNASSRISHNADDKTRPENWLCFYHFRYKEKAHKCIGPCNFQKQKNLRNRQE